MTRGNRKRRFGIAQDIELENRLLSIERELAKLAPLDTTRDSYDRRMYVGSIPPQVTGITVQKSPGTITIQWNKLNATNVSHYEVQIADNAAYTSPTIARVQDAFHTYQDAAVGDLLSTFHVRVRAVINKAAGPWSSPTSSALGLVTTNNILPGAVSLLAEEEVTTFDPTSLTGPGDVTYGSAQLPALGGVVFPRVILELDISTVGDTVNFMRLTTQFIRNPGNVIVGTYKNDLQSTLVAARLTLGGFSEFDAPGVGAFTYSVKIALTVQGGAPTAEITPVRLLTQLTEQRK